MNKKLRFGCTLALALSCTTFVACNSINKASAEPITTYFVDFFDNYLREDFVLSSGFLGRGNNIIYKTVPVAANNPVEKPVDPTRKNYDFDGWYQEEKCINAWDFTTVITKNTRLFAKWVFASEEIEPEPEYTPPSTVLEDTAETDYVLDSIMYFKVENNIVKLSSAALAKLEAQKDNVLTLMEYRVKANKNITATFADNKIVITCGDEVRNISVVNDSLNLRMNDTNYETKASKYEAKALEEDIYHVMLAGSSSIEFWESSKEDLEPIVSFNHGIGGTTIEDWDTKLNKRLVYPYKPKMVVYYVGINNVINSKQSAETIWGHLKNFMDHTHEALPNTKIQYIMMNQLSGYADYHETINKVNNEIIRYQKSNDWLTLINSGLALLKVVEGAEEILPVGAKVNIKSNIELSAVWVDGEEIASKYVISFDAGEGTGEMADVKDVSGEYELPECTFTAPKDKEFDGWKVNGQGRKLQPGTKITVASNIRLVATWIGSEKEEPLETFKVRFDANGAEGTMATVDGVLGQYTLPGCYFTAPEGKKFGGWRVYGDPNAAYFRTDGLHLSYYGYEIWGGIIRQSIVDGLNK